MTTQTLEELAAAKINLTLEVLGRRDDGFHEIRSLMAFAAGCCDHLTLQPGAPVGVDVTGPFADAIVGENLLQRVLAGLATGGHGLALGRIQLDKRLPVAAGIGGGSADAAALLRAIARANPGHAARIDWRAIASGLGSDVPVCLAATPAIVEGVGDVLTPIALPKLAVVLVNPLAQVPADKTARVFGGLGLARGTRKAVSGRPPARFECVEHLLAYMRSTGNDLTAASHHVVPAIGDVLATVAASSACQLAQMSGAGPTVFGVYPDTTAAEQAACAIAAARPDWWVRPTTVGG
jgi:4-diphosphocytidyl-2-C-methyl-D-erythritol kinase